MNNLERRIERLEVGRGPGVEFLFVDRTETGRFINDETGKTYGSVNELVVAKGLDRERTALVHWEGQK